MWKTCGKHVENHIDYVENYVDNMWKTMWKTMDRKKPRRYKAFMNIGKQKESLKEKRMNRNNEKKRDKQRYSPKNENDIEKEMRRKIDVIKDFLRKIGEVWGSE